MKIKSAVYSLLVGAVFCLSCDFEGVKTGETPDTDILRAGDSAAVEENTDTTESTPEELAFSLLDDSVQGQPNNMVYQQADGLRVEWSKKNETNPIGLNDVVLVNYKARIAGGSQYDSNEPIGEPVPLKSNVGMMVKGWEAGLLKMHVGDKGRILIPSALGYGENGLSDIVPPKADLVIDIEIVERIEPIVLEEGVKVYTWKKNKNGVLPKHNQKITFDYFAYTTGAKGHLYDNSFKNGTPFTFQFENDNVVDGLHQGFGVIRTDENAFIEIPYKLAYGKEGLLDLVPKKTDIVYDVRVISYAD